MTTTTQPRGGLPWRTLCWTLAAGVLLLPLIGGAPWTLSDYLTMGALLGIVGTLLELAVRASGSLAFRGGAAVAVLAGFLLVWVNLAVGFLGDEGNPANLMFLGVLFVAAAGAVIAGFQASGMAKAMIAAAAAQVAAGAVGLGLRLGSPGSDGVYEVAMGTGVFTALWLVSAGLFLRAAKLERT